MRRLLLFGLILFAIAPASFACGSTAVDSRIQQVSTAYPSFVGAPVATNAPPTVSTNAPSLFYFQNDFCVGTVYFRNLTRSDITVNLYDGNGNPYLLGEVIPAGQSKPFVFNNLLFQGGVKWTASTSGLSGQVVGYRG